MIQSGKQMPIDVRAIDGVCVDATPADFLAGLTGLSDDPLRRAAQIAMAAIDLTISVGEGTPALTAAYDALQSALTEAA